MITIDLTGKPFNETDAQAYVVFCLQDRITSNPRVSALKKDFCAHIDEIVEARKFNAAKGTSLVITTIRNNKPVYVMLFGLGNVEDVSSSERMERYRRAVGLMIRAAEGVKTGNLAFALPDPADIDANEALMIKELTATAVIAHYQFNQFITKEDRHVIKDIAITVSVPEQFHKECLIAREHGARIGSAVNKAREWCNIPANLINTPELAHEAEVIAASHNLKCTVFGKEEIKKMGMGGLIAVSQGSSHDPRFVILEYKTDLPNAPTIGIVGKGITFDSGGLSIKPAKSMETMKDDMAGAGAVISTMEAIAHLKPKVNVIGVAALAENMISSTAGRPGDIITFYNGMTAEVKNTDAEGRLVLADALSYVTKNYNLDFVIDLATLTGACLVALGHFYSAVLSKHPELVGRIIDASLASGDRVWELPLDDDFKKGIISDVADLANIGMEHYSAGTITAAWFLAHFVGKTPWAHLDIAGTSFNVPGISYYRDGATGAGVRLLIDLIMHWHERGGMSARGKGEKG